MGDQMRMTGQNFGGMPRAVSRLGTGQKDGFQSTGLKNPLNVGARPLSKHGINVAPGTSYGERNVQDRKYFLVLLKNKKNELANEIEKFKKQVDQINEDNETFISLEKKYEALTKEVRELEGVLADYNLAVDKARVGTRPDDIRNIYEHVKNQNLRLKDQVDALFIERKQQEEQIQYIENQLQEIHQQAEMKINELDPDQRSEYDSLINENRQLIQSINAQRNELEEVNYALAQAESKLRLDHTKQKYIQLKDQSVALSKRKEDLEIQTNENNLSFPEARDRLLAKVKEDNASIQSTDKRIREIRQLIANYDRRLKELQSDIENGKDDESKKQQYQALYEKEKELNQFIENFEEDRKQALEEMRRVEGTIADLLEQTSKVVVQSQELLTLTPDQFGQLQSELATQDDQLGKAQSTLTKLNQEYEQRLNELKNFNQAEQKIETEVRQHRENIEKMEDEINNKFERIQDVVYEKERRKNKLVEDKAQLQKMKGSLKHELNSVSYDYDLKKQKMNLHEQFGPLSELEKKLSMNQATIFNLKQFIQSRTVDMSAENLKNECIGLAGQINSLLINRK